MESHFLWALIFPEPTRLFQKLQWIFAKVFPLPPWYFYLEQTTDGQIDLLFWVLRCPAHCTGPDLLPELSQNKICYRIHTKYVFLLFPSNLLFCNLEVFIFAKQELLMPFLIVWRKLIDILKEAEWMLYQASADNFSCVSPNLIYISWTYKYLDIQKVLCNIVQSLDM